MYDSINDLRFEPSLDTLDSAVCSFSASVSPLSWTAPPSVMLWVELAAEPGISWASVGASSPGEDDWDLAALLEVPLWKIGHRMPTVSNTRVNTTNVLNRHNHTFLAFHTSHIWHCASSMPNTPGNLVPRANTGGGTKYPRKFCFPHINLIRTIAKLLAILLNHFARLECQNKVYSMSYLTDRKVQLCRQVTPQDNKINCSSVWCQHYTSSEQCLLRQLSNNKCLQRQPQISVHLQVNIRGMRYYCEKAGEKAFPAIAQKQS